MYTVLVYSLAPGTAPAVDHPGLDQLGRPVLGPEDGRSPLLMPVPQIQVMAWPAGAAAVDPSNPYPWTLQVTDARIIYQRPATTPGIYECGQVPLAHISSVVSEPHTPADGSPHLLLAGDDGAGNHWSVHLVAAGQGDFGRLVDTVRERVARVWGTAPGVRPMSNLSATIRSGVSAAEIGVRVLPLPAGGRVIPPAMNPIPSFGPQPAASVPMASAPPAPAVASSGNSRTALWVILAVIAVVIVVAIPATVLALRSSGSSSPSAGPASTVAALPSEGAQAGNTNPTPDDSEPASPSPAASTEPTAAYTGPLNATVQDAKLSGDRLQVMLLIDCSCTDPVVLAGNRVDVKVSDGSRVLAHGLLDLHTSPVLVDPTGQSSLTVSFPSGSFWLLGSDLNSDGDVVSVTQTTCSDQGRGRKTTAAAPNASTDVTATRVSSAVPAATANANAKKALDAEVAADRPLITSQLADQWVSQVSSKRNGLVADGITYSYTDIYNLFLKQKQQYGNVLLAWSGDWHNYVYGDFYATIIDTPYPDPDGANAWCDEQGIDAANCFATRMATSGEPSGNTKYRS